MDDVHFNPVKHGLVAQPAEWPYSTFNKCGELGLYDTAWSKPDHATTPSDMGERPQRWRKALRFSALRLLKPAYQGQELLGITLHRDISSSSKGQSFDTQLPNLYQKPANQQCF